MSLLDVDDDPLDDPPEEDPDDDFDDFDDFEDLDESDDVDEPVDVDESVDLPAGSPEEAAGTEVDGSDFAAVSPSDESLAAGLRLSLR